MRRRWTPREPGEALADAYVGFALAFALGTSWLALGEHHTVAFHDDWHLLSRLYTTPLSSWILADHNGHLLPLTRLLFYADYRLLQGQQDLLVAASIACAWASLAALYVGFRAHGRLADPLSQSTFAFAGFAWFWAASCYVLLWGTLQAVTQTILGLLVAVSCLLVHRRRPAGRAQPWLVLSIVAAVLATFSSGAGVASWAALAAISLVGRSPARVTLWIALAAALCLLLYGVGLRDLPNASASGYGALLVGSPLEVLGFVATLVGSPIGHVAGGLGVAEGKALHGLNRAAGLAGMVGLAAFAWRLALRPSAVTQRRLLALACSPSRWVCWWLSTGSAWGPPRRATYGS